MFRSLLRRKQLKVGWQCSLRTTNKWLSTTPRDTREQTNRLLERHAEMWCYTASQLNIAFIKLSLYYFRAYYFLIYVHCYVSITQQNGFIIDCPVFFDVWTIYFKKNWEVNSCFKRDRDIIMFLRFKHIIFRQLSSTYHVHNTKGRPSEARE